ncbi:MAG: SoxY-related AACIE arm protein [Rhizomicrobium sp.]
MNILKITRREAVAGGLAALGASALPAPVAALGQMDTAVRNAFGEATIRRGRVMLELPPLVENGNTVPMTVAVDSPMTKDNYVKAIHVFNDKNPQPNVVSVQLGPRAGKATIATRIRLAGTQKLMAIAEMSDGTFWADTQEVIVTLAACLEDLQP